jgi:type II secretory pathway pseudopilin PulG
MRGSSKAVRTAQGGFAYLALLIAIAIIGVAAAATIQLGEIYQRREAEKELLYIGDEFQHALLSYSEATPLGQPTQPRTLDDLVLDPRYPNPVRHLRKIYADPITGKDDWVLVKSPDGQTIAGIHSASTAHPIQIANFPAEFRGFERRKSYTQWVFIARLPQTMPVPGQAPGSVPVDGVAPNAVGGTAPADGASPIGGANSVSGTAPMNPALPTGETGPNSMNDTAPIEKNDEP